MCRPDSSVRSVGEIDISALRRQGIQLILCDLDNTLLRWQQRDVTDAAVAFAKEIKAQGLTLYILSNSSNVQRVKGICDALDIQGVARAGKPLPITLRRELRRRGLVSSQAAMIGDQLLTDMLCAKLSGVAGILVDPIDPSWEHITSKWNRLLERPLRRLYGLNTGDCK